MKNISRRLTGFALGVALLSPTLGVQAQSIITNVSGLRDTPIDQQLEERVKIVIQKAEDYFRKGQLNLQDKKRDQARQDFDKAIETILVSGLNVNANPRLREYYNQLIERIYRLEVPESNANAKTTQPTTSTPDNNLVSSVDNKTEQDNPQVGFTQQEFVPAIGEELAKVEIQQDEAVDESNPEVKKEIETFRVVIARNSFGFSFRAHPLVFSFINYYQGRGRVTMATGLTRSGMYTRMARRIFREEGVPENIVWLGQIESAWKTNALSSASASGLWQFIPGTGARYGLRRTAYLDERNGLEMATRASARYLKFLANRYNGNWELAMAAYNSGEGNVDRAISRAGVADFWAAFPYLPRETRNYVPNILAAIIIANNPVKYGFGNVQPMAPITYDQIRVPPLTSLSVIASASGVALDYIRWLNPEFRQNVSPPEPYIVRVPPNTGNQVVAVLKRMPRDLRNNASVLAVANGEDWKSLSTRTGYTVEQLQAMNPNVDPKKGGVIVVPRNTQTQVYQRPVTPTVQTQQSGMRTVKAVNGDTVTKIAERYGVSTAEVARVNGLLPDTPLPAGREIRIPVKR
jgi:membrane-bound lytic murein transglycosylase D